MKRPVLWPLLAILLVVGAVFATLVFHDRIRQAERTVAQLQEQLRDQVEQSRWLQQTAEALQGQVQDLQKQLAALRQDQQSQGERLDALSRRLEELPEPTPLPSPIDESQLVTVWILAAMAFVFGILNFFLR